jgi:hypothetical protein
MILQVPHDSWVNCNAYSVSNFRLGLRMIGVWAHEGERFSGGRVGCWPMMVKPEPMG